MRVPGPVIRSHACTAVPGPRNTGLADRISLRASGSPDTRLSRTEMNAYGPGDRMGREPGPVDARRVDPR